jgi:hypothetical protein
MTREDERIPVRFQWPAGICVLTPARITDVYARALRPAAKPNPEEGYDDFCASVEHLTTEQLLEQVKALRAARQ